MSTNINVISSEVFNKLKNRHQKVTESEVRELVRAILNYEVLTFQKLVSNSSDTLTERCEMLLNGTNSLGSSYTGLNTHLLAGAY